MPGPHILGHLEYLWSVAYESGNPVIGTCETVEMAAGWVGEPGKLCDALLNAGGPGRCGFIEECKDAKGTFCIHNLDLHAPAYVQKRFASEEKRAKRGESISALRAKAAKSRWDKARDANANGIHLHPDAMQTDANGRPPAPAPAPAPAPCIQEGEGPRPVVRHSKASGEFKTSPEIRKAATEAFDRWAGIPPPVGRSYGLNEIENEHLPVWNLCETVASLTPIASSREARPRHLVIPQVVEALVRRGKEFKSLAFAIGCVKSELEDWAVRGLPTEKGNPNGKPRNEHGRIQENLQL